MRACAERDAFPASDLAIRRELGADPDPEAEAERWRPWRAYGAMHIWTAHTA
jgi:AraC family transcriptional regulator of adaptative response / DNA-3-methyladenine glycosylase II